MPLSPGTRLGPYEILAPIGAGGMGEVYRARDTRLNRDVAIKVSQERFTDRFEREARAVAALNHPNICTLYDVGPDYLVMELVEGESPKGPLPLEEALHIMRQVADALEAAHERGIVHRDLKPGNIKIKPDGTVKVLDFGLAKSIETASGDAQSSPTITISPTQAGMILGTAAYMAPEQARGKTVDKRADIWAFGVVLYELLTGRALFRGEDVTEILASVVKEEPPWDAVPPQVQRLLKSCLEKDPKRRLRDIGDAWRQLEEAPVTARSSSRLGMIAALGVAGAMTLAAGVLALIHFREKPPPVAEPMRFEIPPPAKNVVYACFISPDGRRIAFSARGPDGKIALWVRSVDALESRMLAGTEGVATTLFWSPDSRFIGFTSQGKLKRVEAAGAPPQTVCDLGGFVRGGSWSGDGVIVFGLFGKGLMRVSASGGAASLLVAEPSAGWPTFLPDGRHFVYQRTLNDAEKSGIYLGALDAKPEQQVARRLITAPSGVAYAPTSDLAMGYLLFVREGTLMAQAFDLRKLEISGEAVPVAEGVAGIGANFSASINGALAYRTGVSGVAAITQPTWFDRTGKKIGLTGEAGSYTTLALSGDGTRVALARMDLSSRKKNGTLGMDIWKYASAGGGGTRLTSTEGDFMPVWSPDGSRMVWSSQRGGSYNLYRKDSTGAGKEEELLKSGENKYAYDWSRDGRFLLYSVLSSAGFDLWVLPLTGDDRKPASYLQTQFNEWQARFSPDGRWVAYTSDESRKNEVYVRPFPDAAAGKSLVSRGGGSQPQWRGDGKELYYISADSKMMAVEVSASQVFQTPKELFAAPISGAGVNARNYDVTPDGKKFLMLALPAAETETAASPPIMVVLNWQAGLKK